MTKLSLSIFYAKTSLHKIISEGIQPFVHREKDLNGYYLMLSAERGSHIKFVLKTTAANARPLAKKADLHFNKFLAENPSKSNESLLPKTGFFQNFKNNTIHYGVYQHSVDRKPDVFEAFQQNLSSVIIEIFAFYGQNTIENYFEILFQMIVILFNALEIEIKNAIRLFDILLDMEYQKYDAGRLKEFDEINQANFEKNKFIALQYLKSMSASPTFNVEWQNMWSKAVKECKILLDKVNAEFQISAKDYCYMVNMLCNTFDFKDRISLYYLFSNTLKL